MRCRKAAALIGAASILAMPVAWAGPAQVDSPPPNDPVITTSVPVPQIPAAPQQPEAPVAQLPQQAPPIAPPPQAQPAAPAVPPAAPSPVQAPPELPVPPPVQVKPQAPVQVPQAPVQVSQPPVTTTVVPPSSAQVPPKTQAPKVTPPKSVPPTASVTSLPDSPPPSSVPQPSVPKASPQNPSSQVPTVKSPTAPGGMGVQEQPKPTEVPTPSDTKDVQGSAVPAESSPPKIAGSVPSIGQPAQETPSIVVPHGTSLPSAPGDAVDLPDLPKQPTGGGSHSGPPQQLPPPPPANPFPDWGHKPAVEAQPTPVPVSNGYPGGPPNGQPGGSCGPNGPCGPGGPCGGNGPCNQNGPPPPILGNHDVYNPWQHGNRRRPPPNPNVFVGPGQNNQVVIVNNVTQVNNTVINNAPANIYLTNFVTHDVLSFPANYGTPYNLPSGWCGGVGGSWGWSANVGVPGFGASFAGGGAFNVGGNCGYVPPPPIVQPLYIYSSGYAPWYTNDYFVPQGCGCVYANNTYLYGDYQQQVIEGQPQQVFVPTSYTPDIVFQQPTQGLPPFITGDNPVTNTASQSWFVRQPVILWFGIGIVVIGLLGLAYVNRQRLLSVFR
ncbi:MAG: hypothetical protein H6797_05420 [Candidatus Nomurabacteria bacterium]|nr:MAG: hypothetical protein H6797_05420 [Candidatus Nomurabacteria bacterium]